MEQHTPGPWLLNKGILKGGHILVFSGDYCIAKVYDEEKTSSDTNDANARLIAAAPELLFALQNLLAVKNGDGGTAYNSDDIARAAIAKALGE